MNITRFKEKNFRVKRPGIKKKRVMPAGPQPSRYPIEFDIATHEYEEYNIEPIYLNPGMGVD